MNVLIVSQHFYPENFRINDFAEALIERGHQVTVLTGIPNYPEGRFFSGFGLFSRTNEVWNNIRIIRSPIVARGRASKLRLAVNYASFVLGASIAGLLRLGRKYDVIFVHETSPVTVGIPAIVMKKLTGAPILFWVLDLWPEYASDAGGIKSKMALEWIAELTRWIYSHCDLVLVQSRGFVDSVRRMGVAESRIRYFPSWAESLYSISESQPPVSLPAGFKIMFAGNVGECQDFPSILRAAEITRHRPDIHWVIVGDGRMLPWVKEEVVKRNLGNTVHLMGRYPVESMPSFYSQANVMLVTLKAEGIFALTIPGKVQSYLACGKPVIAMLDGEGAKIIEEAGAGFACPASDAAQLASMVERVASMDKSELHRLGEQGKKFYETEFERNVAISRAEAMFKEVVQ
ncbi:MAG: glycosyltransferase family 4 protein [Gammaproteobacteria bacterium]|nr:glycosyltransferase family 4 protein [Gammaproteobacteria bacterium]MBU1446748.1 glycosyltransferase family 4 protein [Gammaproteobacteria bacterium]